MIRSFYQSKTRKLFGSQRIPCLFFMLLLLVFSACKKEADDTPPGSYLLSKTWKRALIDKNPSTNPAGDILFYPVLDCQKDDTFKFGANGTLTISYGTNKCDSNEASSKTMSYTYNKSTKELIIDGIKYTLAEESGNQLKYYGLVPSATKFVHVVYLFE